MSSVPSVLTIGSALIDTIAIIESHLIERMSMNNADRAYLLLEEGKKTEASQISTHAGGGAVNTAVAFARQGFQVAVIAKLGRDLRGETIKDVLRTEGVSCASIAESNTDATGASMLISSHERNAAIFTFRGANSHLQIEDLPLPAFDRGIVYICSLSDKSADLFPEIVRRATAAGAFVAANPGIRQLSARGDVIETVLPKISVISMNRDEAAALVPRLMSRQDRPQRRLQPAQPPEDSPPLMRRGLSSSGFDMGLPHFLEVLLGLGPACVLLTDGRHGAYAVTGDQITFCPAMPANVVGTAGAGDAFSSTFAAKLFFGQRPGAALRYAAINAASVVAHPDTQTGLLTTQGLDEQLKSHERDLPLSTWTFEK